MAIEAEKYFSQNLVSIIDTNDRFVSRHPEERRVSSIQGDASLRKLRFSMTGRSCHFLSVNAQF
ncbi:hypothetical protein C943_04305 [Mariniradius saccharolyticus AK6]|uniref:Uncharacterized protein n=1 Tax=Mariniradius saccharolyticus AK6 TaxID=1239962 RepID=M7XY74_9BACT|nr:hypothetical protein C943_04305 [Mariniradius saccharolyticus AK6]